MDQTYLPGKVRDRIRDLMQEKGLTQADLAKEIGISESTISRFLSDTTDKLGDENIIRIARVFNVSTDFLLGETDEPDRKHYEISELGLSVQSARNLYTGKVNPVVVNLLLEHPGFAETTKLIARLLSFSLVAGLAAQNQIIDSVASALINDENILQDVKSAKTPIYQPDLSAIQNSFMKTVRNIRDEALEDATNISKAKELSSEAVERIFAELPKNGEMNTPNISKEVLSGAVARSVSHLGVNTENVNQAMLTMLTMIDDVSDNISENVSDDVSNNISVSENNASE